MNVEQMIERNAIEKAWSESPHKGINQMAAFKTGFNAGVRHAIAAMFPVVRVEELENEKFYFIRKDGELVVAECCRIEWDSTLWEDEEDAEYVESERKQYPKFYFYHFGNEVWSEAGEWSEFRRCPTPDEMGVG